MESSLLVLKEYGIIIWCILSVDDRSVLRLPGECVSASAGLEEDSAEGVG